MSKKNIVLLILSCFLIIGIVFQKMKEKQLKIEITKLTEMELDIIKGGLEDSKEKVREQQEQLYRMYNGN